MPGIRLDALVRRLQRDATPDAGEGADAALVARFAASRDEAAFELLVRRHGAMVLAACRRVLGQTEDAEDAFQAAFLVLARKAASVRRGTAVPAWLHRVAVRIAQRAADRRRPTTTLVAEPPARPTPDAVEQSELRGLIDAEIDRLSEPFRRAFVLCYLEGLSNADAARVLGCPVGTVESRLTTARRTLRNRLALRIELSAGILALLACPSGLPAEIVATLTRAGVMAAQNGLRSTIGIVREPAIRLAEGGIRAMNPTIRTWMTVVLGVSLIGLAAGVGWANRPADPPAEREVVSNPPVVAPPPTPAREPATKDEAWPLAKQFSDDYGGRLLGVSSDGKSLLFSSGNMLYGLSLDGKENPAIRAYSQNAVSGVAISPDGKYVATAEGENGVKLRDAAPGRILEALWPKGDLPAYQVAFTPDGKNLVVFCSRTSTTGNKGNTKGPSTSAFVTRVSVWDLATRKELGHPAHTDTNEPRPHYTLAGHGRFVVKTQAIYDGKTDAGPGGPLVKSVRFTITDAVSGKAGKPIEVDGASFGEVRPDPLSPDGKTLVLLYPAQHELRFLDTETGKDRFLVPAFRRSIGAVAFSPDGRFVAAATGDGQFVTGVVSGAMGRRGKGANSDPVAAPSEVVIWDATTGRELARLVDKETIRNYTDLAFSPDGSFLAAQAQSQPERLSIWGHLPVGEPAPEPVKPVWITPREAGLNSDPAFGQFKPGEKREKRPKAGPAPAREPVLEPADPAAKTPKAGAVPARFETLIRELSDAGVTDSRRVEALILAALGRFPTEVETRTLAAQLARSEDKAAALRDLLGTLTETNEFRSHAEELGRLAK